VVRFQRHAIDWSTRYYPNGAFDGFYPAGMWEDLDTHADDVFARAQLSFDLDDRADLLLGVEADRFFYDGDREHDSNVDVDDAAGGFPPNADGATMRLGPWLDYVLDHPITDLAAYAQLSARRRAGIPLGLTLGARWDHQSFDFDAIGEPGRPTRDRTFDQVSPRLAVVLEPAGTVSIKLLGGEAFRAPTPTELAGAHTFSLASNIEELEPETISTGELLAEWSATRTITVRGSLFYTRFENQIAYSAANFNLSTNLFTTETSGLETEVLYARGRLSGFFNHSWARREDEESIDPTIAASPDRVAWAPAHVLNAGAGWSAPRFTAALSVHWQGSTARRSSDVGVETLPFHSVALDLDTFRPRTLDGWLDVDARVSTRLPHGLTLAVTARNLFDEEQTLVKVLPFPFDYRQETRRVTLSLRLDI
jgi:iron complex outermembrane receptor protein